MIFEEKMDDTLKNSSNNCLSVTPFSINDILSKNKYESDGSIDFALDMTKGSGTGSLKGNFLATIL